MHDPGDSVWAPSRRGLTAGLVATITLFASESLAVSTILPDVAKDLGRAGYGAVFSLFFLGSIVGVLIGGPAADRYGLRKPFVSVVVLFALGLVIGGLAPTMWLLIVGRFLQGLGAGASAPIIYAAIGRTYSHAAQVKMFAVTSTAWVVPGVIGPGLAGLVSDQFGWRWIFLGLLPLVVLATIVTVPKLENAPASGEMAVPFRPTDIARFTVGAGLLLAALASNRLPLALLTAGVGVAIGAGSARRVFPPGLIRLQRGTAATVALRGLLTFVFIVVDAFVPLVIASIRGRSVLMSSAYVTTDTLAWTIGAWVAANLQERRGPAWLVRQGFLALAVGTALELVLVFTSIPLGYGFVGAVLVGLGMGLAYAPMTSVVLALSPEGQQGTSSSALALSDGLGFSFGAAVMGAFISVGSHLHWHELTPYVLLWPMTAAMAMIGFFTAHRMNVG
jgi:MFS family permease